MLEWPQILRTFLGRYSAEADRLYKILVSPGMHQERHPPHGTVLCEKGQAADCFWLIVDGRVDVYEGPDSPITQRGQGELIGEQAFLAARTPCLKRPDGKALGRTTKLTTHGNTVLLRFDAAPIEALKPEDRALWYELLAHVVNDKLIQATHQRAQLVAQLADRDKLLARFCDETALGTVQAIIGGGQVITSLRKVVVWFSDIAGFSTWSRRRDPVEVAQVAQALLGLQVNLIRRYGGEIDKLMGDGLMAYWFCDGDHRNGVPTQAYECARKVVREFATIAANRGIRNLSLRIGLHTGQACFGDFGTEDRIAVTLLGETVNLASRYEQLPADPEQYPDLGPIRISPELHALICTSGAVSGLNGPFNANMKHDSFIFYWAEGGSDGMESR